MAEWRLKWALWGSRRGNDCVWDLAAGWGELKPTAQLTTPLGVNDSLALVLTFTLSYHFSHLHRASLPSKGSLHCSILAHRLP